MRIERRLLERVRTEQPLETRTDGDRTYVKYDDGQKGVTFVVEGSRVFIKN